MRIAVGQLWQDTNTFNPLETTYADFENWGVAVGDAVLAEYGTTGEIGGFCREVERWSSPPTLCGLARFACWPGGSMDVTAWSRIRQTFDEQLLAVGPVDAIFLALHGALAAVDEPDVTGALLELVRKHVGADVPIVGSLDLHANITARMMTCADVMAGYHTAPHLDAPQTGARAARALEWIVEAEGEVHTYTKTLPMITAAENQNTFEGPPAPLYRRLEAAEENPAVLTAGLYMAMPWFDCPSLGWTVTLSTKDASDDWQSWVDSMAVDCWGIREELENVDRLTPEAAVQEVHTSSRFPVVIGDGADSTNSGAPGDSTVLLEQFLAQPQIPRRALTFLVDPEAVAAAVEVGEGGMFDRSVGAPHAPEYCRPVNLQGTVTRLCRVEFVLDGHIGKNLPIRMGRGAVVESETVVVLLVEKSGPGSSPLLYEAAGLDPRTFGVVVAKSPTGFRADYESFAGKIVLADCPGCAAPHWSKLPFHNVCRPLWPLDPLSVPDEASWCKE